MKTQSINSQANKLFSIFLLGLAIGIALIIVFANVKNLM